MTSPTRRWDEATRVPCAADSTSWSKPPDARIRHRWFDNGARNGGGVGGPFHNLGGTSVNESGPTAVSWGPGRIDVFMRASGNGLFHRYYR
jgi:hypothetical protein